MRSAGASTTQLQVKNTTRNGKRALLGWQSKKISKEPSVRFAGRGEFLLKEQEEHGFQSLSRTAIKKVKTHAKSDIHIQSCKAEVAAARALQDRLIFQQLQQIGDQEKLKNRMAIKALICCTHFLARHHIPHTTNFDELIDLIVCCGAIFDFHSLKFVLITNLP